MYQLGQEIIIRCNGLAVGRYANQPQLCVPSYNNNIYAMNASQKVGWCPGRIQGSIFRRATKMIGMPDQSKLKYDTITVAKLFNTLVPKKPTVDAAGMDAIRKADGRLIVLKGVHFTGQYYDNGALVDCNIQHPDSDGGANVFAPTTKNIGYPQSRVLQDQGTNTVMCSCSEYAKFACYYLPGADATGIGGCQYWEGTVTGILGWYLDKASSLSSNLSDYVKSGVDYSWTIWSVTPRGIPGIGISDINMYYQGDKDSPWIPKEYDPKANTTPAE